MTEAQLHETIKTGKAPPGFEIEHQYVPQRVTKLLIAAGIPDSEVARLGRLGDPPNLYPTRKEIHAVLDEEAAQFTNGIRACRLPLTIAPNSRWDLWLRIAQRQCCRGRR
jgi:hypothetical protein